jgi:hypothetical protein
MLFHQQNEIAVWGAQHVQKYKITSQTCNNQLTLPCYLCAKLLNPTLYHDLKVDCCMLWGSDDSNCALEKVCSFGNGTPSIHPIKWRRGAWYCSASVLWQRACLWGWTAWGGGTSSSGEGCEGWLTSWSGRASCAGGGAPNTPRGASEGRATGAGGAGSLGNALAKSPLIASCLWHRLLDCRAVMVVLFSCSCWVLSFFWGSGWWQKAYQCTTSNTVIIDVHCPSRGWLLWCHFENTSVFPSSLWNFLYQEQTPSSYFVSLFYVEYSTPRTTIVEAWLRENYCSQAWYRGSLVSGSWELISQK